MKNIFKLLGIAVLACGMMVACGGDEPEPTPDTIPVVPPTPQVNHDIDITWDGAAQTLGYKNVIVDNSAFQGATVYEFEAAAGLANDEYVFPAFLVPFVNAEGIGFDHATGFSAGGTNLNAYLPTEAYIDGGVELNGEVSGDWQLASMPTSNGVSFDATAMTITANMAFVMYDYTEFAEYYVEIVAQYSNGELTQDEAEAALNSWQPTRPTKNMTFVVNGYNL